MKISMGYPSYDDELDIMSRAERSGFAKNIQPVMTLENVRELMGYAENVTAELSVRKYILSLVTATRNSDYVKLGVSPRGSIALLKASKPMPLFRAEDLSCQMMSRLLCLTFLHIDLCFLQKANPPLKMKGSS